MKSKGTLNVEDQQYGVWLRARHFNPFRKSFVEVKGFSTFTSFVPFSSSLNVIGCSDDIRCPGPASTSIGNEGKSMEVASSMVEPREMVTFEGLKGCSDVIVIDSTFSGVVSTCKVSPNFEETTTELDQAIYELPSTTNVVVPYSNTV